MLGRLVAIKFPHGDVRNFRRQHRAEQLVPPLRYAVWLVVFGNAHFADVNRLLFEQARGSRALLDLVDAFPQRDTVLRSVEDEDQVMIVFHSAPGSATESALCQASRPD